MSVFQKIILLTLLFVCELFVYGNVANAQINVSTNLIKPTVEMIWEVNSYIPPFYKGKALYPVGGKTTVLALPPASMGDPATLTYKWKRDGTAQGSLSGVGKQSFTFEGSQFGDVPLIVVEVSNGKTKEIGMVKMQKVNPIIRFYENRPLEGIALERVLPTSFTTTEKDMIIEAYPYFSSTHAREEGSLSYTWTANGQKVSGATGASVAIQSDEPRTIQLQLLINHVTEILQRASSSITITLE
ncbi:hypothetical protein IPJ70_03095 [Candidatus Campbellbacteria bacterium]|nr:MAG: hypothetical protein IPJ70_03095 [Candidatus Campbellbacteria bacterium]